MSSGELGTAKKGDEGKTKINETRPIYLRRNIWRNNPSRKTEMSYT